MFEYKVIPAPLRTAKVKGLKTTAERFAFLIENAVNAEAEGGWDFVRAETLPCEERKGLTGTAKSFQTVLVFRRALQAGAYGAGADEDAQPAAGTWAAANTDTTGGPSSADTATDTGSDTGADPQSRASAGRVEPLFRPGAALRSETTNRAEPTLRARPPEGDADSTDNDQR